jgi:acyl-CoA thioesterase FadM
MNKLLSTPEKSKTTKARTKNNPRPTSKFGPTPLQGSGILQNVQINWLDSGKPVLEGLEKELVDVSLSHDDRVCLCVAGIGPQGCDIAPVTHRLREDWTALLSNAREPLMQQLLEKTSDSVDQAGTRIWAAVEAVRKATNAQRIDLEIDRYEGDSTLFRGMTADNQTYVLTFPLTLTRGPQRIVAVVVSTPPTAATKVNPSPETVQNIYSISNPDQNHKIFVVRSPVCYKETANLSQSVYFSHFFNWMGKVRDLAIWSIREPLGQHLATGQWGMVTNHAETRILGEAGLNDVIEGRYWVANVSGPANSTVDFRYDWLKVLPDGSFERIAQSQLCMTWVNLAKQGPAEPKPLPDYLEKFINQLCDPAYTPQSLPESFADINVGKELYRVLPGIKSGRLLREQILETSLEDTDAIGNINFANYYVWQGRIRDSFFYQLIPDSYHRTANQGEFRCLHSRVENLREALPFDQIQVNMSLRAVYEKSVSLTFEYFRLTPDGKKQKLAVGEHEAAWFSRNQDGKFLPAPLPEVVRLALCEQS